MDEKPAWRLTFQIDKADLMDIMEALEAPFENEPTSVSGFEDTETEIWYAEALYKDPPDEGLISRLIESFTHGALTIEPLPDIDWVSKSFENLKPVRAGRFYVYAAHNEMEAGLDEIPLMIGAGQAFGTGHHATTAGCLTALGDIAAEHSIKKALDIGCGTAILAVGLSKVSDARIIASDNDPIAIEVADQVIAENKTSANITTLVAEGVDDPMLKAEGPYDLVLANILAAPLIELAPEISTQVAKGGHLILSGLLATQTEKVLKPYLQQGFKEVRRIPLEEWMTLVLER